MQPKYSESLARILADLVQLRTRPYLFGSQHEHEVAEGGLYAAEQVLRRLLALHDAGAIRSVPDRRHACIVTVFRYDFSRGAEHHAD